jgi:hypothetical protein
MAFSNTCATWKYNGTGLERSMSTVSVVVTLAPILVGEVLAGNLHEPTRP